MRFTIKLFIVTLFFFFSQLLPIHAETPSLSTSKISLEERRKVLKTLRILLDEKDTELLTLLTYYKDQKAIANDDDRRMPTDNSKIATTPTSWMVIENTLKENHVVVSKEEWRWIDTECLSFASKEAGHDACRLRYVTLKKQHQDDRIECYRHAVASFPDKLKKEAMEIDQTMPVQNMHRKQVIRKIIGPFSEEELKNYRISSRNDCMAKKNWKHPMDWKEGTFDKQ